MAAFLGLLLITALFVGLVSTGDGEAATSPSLGTASSFAILAGTAITNVPTSAITGDVGLSPASGAFIGLTCPEVTGTIYTVAAAGPLPCRVANDSLLTDAKADLAIAYDALAAGANAPCTVDYGNVVTDLSGLFLEPGVYCTDVTGTTGAFTLTGTLNLVGSGVWIFRSGSTLITSGTANVVGGDPCSVWWRVPSSATFGTDTSLIGNILALTSITMASGAELDGRALARNAAVTLSNNQINSDNCAAPATSTPTSTATNTPTATATDTATATATPTQTATATQAVGAAATATQTPTPTQTATATGSATATATQAPSATTTPLLPTATPVQPVLPPAAPVTLPTPVQPAAPMPPTQPSPPEVLTPPQSGDGGLLR